LPPPIRESVFLENRLPFMNAYSTENLPPPLGHNPPPPTGLGWRPAQTAQPTWPLSHSARACLWRILQKIFSSLIHAFRSRCLLSLPSLMHGPRLSALSSTPRRPTSIAPPPSPAASGLSAPLLRTSRCRPKSLLAPPSLHPSSSHALTRRDEPIYSAIEATPLAGRYPAFTAPTPLLPTL
jgi:hypothetical protein